MARRRGFAAARRERSERLGRRERHSRSGCARSSTASRSASAWALDDVAREREASSACAASLASIDPTPGSRVGGHVGRSRARRVTDARDDVVNECAFSLVDVVPKYVQKQHPMISVIRLLPSQQVGNLGFSASDMMMNSTFVPRMNIPKTERAISNSLTRRLWRLCRTTT